MFTADIDAILLRESEIFMATSLKYEFQYKVQFPLLHAVDSMLVAVDPMLDAVDSVLVRSRTGSS